VIDELTLVPPIAPISMSTTLAAATPRVADSGICGLVARPVDVSAALTRPNGFEAAVAAPGYLPRDLTPAIEAARRSLNTGAGTGVTTLDVLPGDPAPRQQFTPGRGVLLERAVGTDPEEFTTVDVTGAPPAATDVPIRDGVVIPRPANARVAGVPMTLPDQPLHRAGSLRIRGIVRLRTGPSTIVPAVGAAVSITGVWWDYPSSVTAAPLAPDLCAIDPTLRLAYPVGTAVGECPLTPAGASRTLREVMPAGARVAIVAPNALLTPAGGDILQIGDDLTADDEVVVTDGFDPVADPDAPVRIALRTPTDKLHRAGEPVQAMTQGVVTPVGSVAREGLAGDAVLFCPGLPALAPASTIVVADGTPRATFYRATQLPSTPIHLVPLDTKGRFTWPPIARIAQVRVVADLPPHPPVQVDMALDYGGDSSLAIVLT
jgi:hypothetical protein